MQENTANIEILVVELSCFAKRLRFPKGASGRFIKKCPQSLLRILTSDDDLAPATLAAITMRAWETRSRSVTCTEDEITTWTACLRVSCSMELLIREGLMVIESGAETIFDDLSGNKPLVIRMTDKGLELGAAMESAFLAGTLSQEYADMYRRSKVRGI